MTMLVFVLGDRAHVEQSIKEALAWGQAHHWPVGKPYAIVAEHEAHCDVEVDEELRTLLSSRLIIVPKRPCEALRRRAVAPEGMRVSPRRHHPPTRAPRVARHRVPIRQTSVRDRRRSRPEAPNPARARSVGHCRRGRSRHSPTIQLWSAAVSETEWLSVRPSATTVDRADAL